MRQEVFHALLSTGVKHGASDIHFRPGAPPMYRVSKQLVPLKSDALTPQVTEALARQVLQSLGAKDELAVIQEYDTSYSVPGVARFRVNIYRQRGSLALVMRIISSKVPTVEELGLPPVIKKIAETDRGLVLVTGATGSGKTTTLAAMIHQINQSKAAHILTIEDPIEFLHPNIRASLSQRELGIDTPSFVAGLRAALRQDPDVILVGEMRDAESVDIALKAAETGHMVFSTVHTTDAPKTIGRILGVFSGDEEKIIRQRLADNLRATISQRLLPRADGKGLCVACEIMIVTGSVREAILNPAHGSLTELIEQGARQYHMQSFDQHLMYLARNDQITVDTAMQFASNPTDFKRSLDYS